MIAEIVMKILEATASIATAATGGIHYAEQPQSYPTQALVIQRLTAPRQHHLKGPNGVVQGLVRVTALGSTYLGVADLAEQVRQALDGFSGTVGTVTVSYLFLDDMTDLPSEHLDGQGQIRTHGVQVDFRYQYKETPAAPAPDLS